MDSKFKYSEKTNDLEGNVFISVPVKTRHDINISYNLKEDGNIRLGNATVDYNFEQILDGNYSYKSVLEYVLIYLFKF